MAVRLADTLAPMGDFEVAEAKDVSVDIKGTKKMLQKAIDDGDIGGGGGGTENPSWTGTKAEFEALDKSTLKDGQQVNITDDSDKSLIDDSKATPENVWSAEKVSVNLVDKVPFKFGVTEDGQYGYYKAGADTVTPFKSGSSADNLWTNESPLGTNNIRRNAFGTDISIGNLQNYNMIYALCEDNIIGKFIYAFVVGDGTTNKYLPRKTQTDRGVFVNFNKTSNTIKITNSGGEETSGYVYMTVNAIYGDSLDTFKDYSDVIASLA